MPALGSIDRFFETTTSPYRMGLVRIPIGLVCLLDALVTRRDLDVLFRPDALRVPLVPWLPAIQAGQSDIYAGLWIIASLLFITGLFTRAAGAALALCFAYRLALDQTLYTTNIYLCGLLVLLLVIGNAGQAVSLDARRRGGRPRDILRWPETLLKLQISLVYLFTAIEKINPVILDGERYRRFLPAFWEFPPLVYLAFPFAVILFELLMSVSLWWRPTRGWAFLIGLVFHTAILVQIGFYAPLMAYSTMFVGSYFLFVDEEARSRTLAGPPALLAWVRRFDWLRIHHYRPGSATLSLHTGRQESSGWPAFRATLSVLPVTCLWAAVFDLPLFRNLGRTAYERLALYAPSASSSP